MNVDPTGTSRAALRVLQVGAIACVLGALPYTVFDLDRHAVPKELVLHATAFGGAALLLARARRVSVSLADLLIAASLAVSTLSALFATNHWLAFRALGVSLSAVLVFWCARSLAQAGLGRQLINALALGVVLTAGIALLQAYGVESSLMAERRAPGGLFGNRNFVAHFVALGLPVLILAALEARHRLGIGLAWFGTMVVGAALLLSRSRAAWLGAGLALAIFAAEGLWRGGLWRDRSRRLRVIGLGVAALIGVVLARVLPNRLEWRSDSPYLDSLVGIADYKEGSGHGRLVQYENTLKMALDHPILGVGPGNWPVAYPKYTFPGDPAFDPNDFIPTNPWPSSDWVAFLAERGAFAPLLLLLAGVVLGVGAWRRWRLSSDQTEGIESLAAVLTLLILLVVSTLDAVLLLPAPSFYAAAIVGALVRSPRRAVREVGLEDVRRRRLVNGVLGVGGLLVLRSLSQIVAMAVFSGASSPAGLEWAGRIDPGSYRIQVLLGYAWRNRGQCDRARPHAEAARRLMPNLAAPGRLLGECGGTGRRRGR